MDECKACGTWFSSSEPQELCTGCERALKRLNGYVAPVRHGRWLCVDTDTEQFFLCNRCKKKEYWESDYCPSCGAKMDGGAN